MLFVAMAHDKENAEQVREMEYSAHRTHLAGAAQMGIGIVLSGPLISDDGRPIGSLLVLDGQDRDAVEAFLGADPFHKSGVWQCVTVTGFVKRRG